MRTSPKIKLFTVCSVLRFLGVKRRGAGGGMGHTFSVSRLSETSGMFRRLVEIVLPGQIDNKWSFLPQESVLSGFLVPIYN